MFDNRQGFDPAKRGLLPLYREHEVNHCPGCNRTHWLIGRVSAECAFCSTALPLAASLMQGAAAPVFLSASRRSQFELAAA